MANETPPETIGVYRGDDFLVDGVYRDENHVPIDLNAGGIVVSAWIKGRNDAHFDLNVTYPGGVGEYHIEGDSDNWPLGNNRFFVRYTVGTVEKTLLAAIIEVQDA